MNKSLVWHGFSCEQITATAWFFLEIKTLLFVGGAVRFSVVVYQQVFAQFFDVVSLQQRVSPFKRNIVVSVRCACQAAGNCGGGIGVIAQIYGFKNAFFVGTSSAQTPNCRFQRMNNVAVANETIG